MNPEGQHFHNVIKLDNFLPFKIILVPVKTWWSLVTVWWAKESRIKDLTFIDASLVIYGI